MVRIISKKKKKKERKAKATLEDHHSGVSITIK